MIVAIVGSRNLSVPDLSPYLPEGTTEIVSGGARGVDACARARGVDASAREYAFRHGLKLTEFLPEYEKYGRNAPLKRNLQIIGYADLVVALWDGTSRGTKHVIDSCKRQNIPILVHLVR